MLKKPMKIDHNSIDYKNMESAGTSKPKIDKRELFKGIWYIYLFLCATYFGLIVADLIDGNKFYISRVGFFIIFFIPCIAYLVYRTFKSDGYQKTADKYTDLQQDYKLLKTEFDLRDREWQEVVENIASIKSHDYESKEEFRKEITKLNNIIDLIEASREKREYKWRG